MEKYNWKIIAYDYKTNVDGLQNVIENIHWRYGNEEVDTYGVISLPSPTPENFINIDNVTKEIASNWLEFIFSKVNISEEGVEEPSNLEQMKKLLDEKLASKQYPNMITKYLE